MTPLSDSILSDLRSFLVSALSGLSISNDGAWLPNRNRYLRGGSNTIVHDCKAGVVNFQDMANYIGASAFAHCADAWSYIGRAADALLKGDVHTSVHLLYYGELRAAESLLATEGVFVGNTFSCGIVEEANVVKLNDKTTHQAAWELIDGWFKMPTSITSVSNVIEPGGQSLQSWIAGIPGGADAVIQDMLAGLAFDLKSFHDDRNRRNLASYDPATLIPSSLDVGVIQRTIGGLWEDIEPMPVENFPNIDRAIVANVLYRQYIGQYENIDSCDTELCNVDWSHWGSWIDSLSPTSLKSTAFCAVLRGGPEGLEFQNLLGSAFEDTSGTNEPVEFIESMFSRVTVLTRIATGFCRRLLRDAGKTVQDIAAWTSAFARSRGHVAANLLPTPVTDLFGDILSPRDLLIYSQAESLGDLHRDIADGAGFLGQTDRVVVWAFA